MGICAAFAWTRGEDSVWPNDDDRSDLDDPLAMDAAALAAAAVSAATRPSSSAEKVPEKVPEDSIPAPLSAPKESVLVDATNWFTAAAAALATPIADAAVPSNRSSVAFIACSCASA